MHAEIIAIGTELTSGAKLDSNSQWLSLELADVGIPVHYHSTVADDQSAMVAVMREAVNRSDLVLITGGLGPTLDDLTRQALAELTQTKLVLHEPSLEFIKSMFARRNRAMAKRNEIQAMFPEGSVPIPNLRGTAPGIWMEIPRKSSDTPAKLAAMPGVPSEMKHMFHEQVLQKLPDGERVIRRARVNCFGIGESDAEQQLGDLTARNRDPEVGITVHEATITLRITAHGNSVKECDDKIAATKKIIHQRMGQLVFGEEDEELEQIVIRLLKEKGFTLATAESGTGGLLAHRLTEVDEFQNNYLGGVVAPTSQSKRDLLHVEPGVLETNGPISSETAEEMAVGCRKLFNSDFAISVTEYPRFDPDDTQSDAPVAYIALAGEGLLEIRKQTLLGDPAIIKSRTAKAALNLLRLHLNQ
ncbi:MAG: CinA family nicotinamide mononucleotide deamidase-related protein [Planctomycetes bacterium]|nr:CinA family nicotinamide mononucleotide deamidase-related protein [Planctomycetota bacterium]